MVSKSNQTILCKESLLITKVDLKKELKSLYQPSAKQPEILEVPKMNFLMMDGSGNPNTSPGYQKTVEALYGVAYTLKFASKKMLEQDYAVMPLEGLWWGTPMGQHTFGEEDKDQFQWTMMIMQPDFITSEMVNQAIAQVKAKKGLESLDQMRYEAFTEGLSVQILYYGSYDDEGPTIANMHQFAFDQGYRLRGKHHEIYLSDPRRTSPEKLKTILRHPIERAS
jgi:hypothetical protein